MKPRVLSADPEVAHAELADIALEANEAAIALIAGQWIAALPDVVCAEYAANGRALPMTWGMTARDGRTVRFYVIPRPGVVA